MVFQPVTSVDGDGRRGGLMQGGASANGTRKRLDTIEQLTT